MALRERKWKKGSEKEVEAVGRLTTKTYPWDPQFFAEIYQTPKMLGMSDFLREGGKGKFWGLRVTHRNTIFP